MTRRTITYRRPPGRLGALSVATVLFAAYVGLGASPAHAQSIDLAEFATVDWSDENDEPPGFPPFTPIRNGSELTLDESEYAAIVSPNDAISGPGEVFEISLLHVDPAADDDFWGLTFGLQANGAIVTEGDAVNGPPINNDADWVFWTWKSHAQPIDQPNGPLSSLVQITGPVRTGLALARVQGLVANDEFAHRLDHVATPGVLTPLADALPGSLGDSGDAANAAAYKTSYEALPNVCTRTRYSTTGVQVWANGELVLDHTAAAPLPTGSWGLVFAAQDLGTYRVGRYLCPGDNDGDGDGDGADTDDDGDGIPDSVELADGLEGDANGNNIPDFADFSLATFNDANGDGIDDDADFDGDGVPNHFDLDSDADGGPDNIDPQPLNTAQCGDSDQDGCDDCAVQAVATPGDDGLDTDGDGLCDVGDDDDDGDGVDDSVDVNPLDASLCADSDEDGCDDCAVQDSTTPSDDGLDTDGDGLCDVGDSDDDGDGVDDGLDAQPLNASVCADSDVDGCDDCAVQDFATPSDDGSDTDGDGLCDVGDSDDDGDGVDDAVDLDPIDHLVCSDTDLDDCDDCSVSGSQTPNTDGLDTDGDGLCDEGDLTPFGPLEARDAGTDAGMTADAGASDGGDPFGPTQDGGDAGGEAAGLDAGMGGSSATGGNTATGGAGGSSGMGGTDTTGGGGAGGSDLEPELGGFQDAGVVLTGDGNDPAVVLFDEDGCACAVAGGASSGPDGAWSLLGLAAAFAGGLADVDGAVGACPKAVRAQGWGKPRASLTLTGVAGSEPRTLLDSCRCLGARAPSPFGSCAGSQASGDRPTDCRQPARRGLVRKCGCPPTLEMSARY